MPNKEMRATLSQTDRPLVTENNIKERTPESEIGAGFIGTDLVLSQISSPREDQGMPNIEMRATLSPLSEAATLMPENPLAVVDSLNIGEESHQNTPQFETMVIPSRPRHGTPLLEITNISSHPTTVFDDPKPSTSKASKPFIFSPETVRPLPKAPPRKITNRGRKKRQTAIYTDTPVKDAIQKEAEETKKRKKAKQIKKNLQFIKSKEKKRNSSQKKKTAPKNDSESSEEEEWFCVVCMEPYSTSRPNEMWIQCSQCMLWAHEECTPQESSYICHNCNFD